MKLSSIAVLSPFNLGIKPAYPLVQVGQCVRRLDSLAGVHDLTVVGLHGLLLTSTQSTHPVTSVGYTGPQSMKKYTKPTYHISSFVCSHSTYSGKLLRGGI